MMLIIAVTFIGICMYICIGKYGRACAKMGYEDKYSKKVNLMIKMIKKYQRVIDAILYDSRNDTPMECAKKWKLTERSHEEKTMKAIELLDGYSEDVVNLDEIKNKLKNIKFNANDWEQIQYQCLKLNYGRSCELYVMSENILEYINECDLFGLKFENV